MIPSWHTFISAGEKTWDLNPALSIRVIWIRISQAAEVMFKHCTAPNHSSLQPLPSPASQSPHSQHCGAAWRAEHQGLRGTRLQNSPWVLFVNISLFVSEGTALWDGQLIVSFLLQMLNGRGIVPKPAKNQLSSSYFNTLVWFSCRDEQMQALCIWIWHLNGTTHF